MHTLEVTEHRTPTPGLGARGEGPAPSTQGGGCASITTTLSTSPSKTLGMEAYDISE